LDSRYSIQTKGAVVYRKKLIDKIKLFCEEEVWYCVSDETNSERAEHDKLILEGRAEMSETIIKLINETEKKAGVLNEDR